ncbi:MAG: acylphosphatase [Xanthobacteraceae bacterium]|nr:acylphosphatase [Xanthobacteraceae bacterium]PWB58304.1 MAG: acylphosphatase [Bradyrhizobiaceae bacterium]
MTEIVRRVVIHGRVQGVGYRAWVEDEAQARGLAGWVRNRRDGSVEAVFGGGERIVTDMITACHRGPAAARVTAVELHPADARALASRVAGERFSVLGTV